MMAVKTIFRSIYALIFIDFLRKVYAIIYPTAIDTPELMPTYIILALFSDEAILLGYSDDWSVCQRYSSYSKWTITCSVRHGIGYADVNVNERGKNDESAHDLKSVFGVHTCHQDYDLKLAKQFGFRREVIDYLAKRYHNGNYI